MCISKHSRSRPVVIRSVWSENLDLEFETIRSIINKYPVISMDTEFPGVVVPSEAGYVQQRDPVKNYMLLKANVDLLRLIQVGLTLSDERGNLPDLGTGNCYIWEFNFNDFDLKRHDHASDSVELLRRQGIDFERNLEFGIESARFAELMMSSGLVCNDEVSWVTFHSAYDFGYLVKILTQRDLPTELMEFLDLVKVFFGSKVYDVKHLMKFAEGLYGGLDRVGEVLSVKRATGKSHQAGSDSLLTLHVFQKMMETHIPIDALAQNANVLFGIECVSPPNLT